MGSGYISKPNDSLYQSVDYSNHKTIQGLVRFYYQLKVENDYRPNFDLITILVDIDIAIKKSSLSNKQRKILNLYMMGYTESKIGKQIGITQQGVNKYIQSTCKAMSDFLMGAKS